MPVIPIRDFNDARISVYRDLRRSSAAADEDAFIAEGKWTVERALASKFNVTSILCDERYVSDLPDHVIREKPVCTAAGDLLSRIVGFEFHRRMLACVGRRSNLALAEMASGESASTLVVCPRIADPANLAGIIRNCAAFGVNGLLIGSTCADAYSRRVARVSMGTLFRVPIRRSPDLQADLKQLRDRWDWELVATVLDPRAPSLAAANRKNKLVLLFGGEGDGLEQEWIDVSDRQVTLPMRSGTDSLNVATACGVFLYHFTS